MGGLRVKSVQDGACSNRGDTHSRWSGGEVGGGGGGGEGRGGSGGGGDVRRERGLKRCVWGDNLAK